MLAGAAAVHAMTGFGFALFGVPLLALIGDTRTAVVGIGVAGVLLNLGTARAQRAEVRWRTVGWLLAAAVLGMPVGVLLLRGLPERVLQVVVAVVVVGCAVLVWRRYVLRGGRPVVAAAGLLSGVLATATGTNGPPLVATFMGLDFSPAEVRASLAAYFSVSGFLSLVAFGLAGALTRPVWVIGAVSVVAVPAGWWVGNHAFRRFDPGRFRQVVLAMLVLTSAVTVWRAVAS